MNTFNVSSPLKTINFHNRPIFRLYEAQPLTVLIYTLPATAWTANSLLQTSFKQVSTLYILSHVFFSNFLSLSTNGLGNRGLIDSGVGKGTKRVGEISTFILWEADRRTDTALCHSLLGAGEWRQSGGQFTPYVKMRVYLGKRYNCTRGQSRR